MRRLLTWTLTATSAWMSASTLMAGTIHAEYYAGPTTATSTPAKVWTPEMWGWYDLYGGSGTGAVNSGGSALNAWRVTDQSAALPNKVYVADFLQQDLDRIAAEGWRMRSSIRYIDDFGANGSLGMSAYIAGRAYHLMLDLTTTGDLRAQLYDETARTFQLTTGGSGTAAFHRYEFLNAPGSTAVSFAVDGVVLDRTWDGISLLNHDSNIQWGNSNQALANVGVADYQSVTFEIGPFTEQMGDFDGNGRIDGRDFLWWQRDAGKTVDVVADANGDGRVDEQDLAIWERNFGRSLPTASTASDAVPEPSLAAWLASLPLAWAWQRYAGR